MNRNLLDLSLRGMNMNLWLASASPRRAAMLRPLYPFLHQEGLDGVDESPPKGTVESQVLSICKRKAAALNESTNFDAILVADTMISDPDDHSLSIGKPTSKAHAAVMLHRLSGRHHQVWTASGLYWNGEWTFWCEHAVVAFPEFSDEVFSDLIESDSWKGKAGGYDLHGAMGEHATLIEGSESVVLGLASGALEHLEALATLL